MHDEEKYEEDEADYEIGYGKPPTHSQFKKGKSGNPLGRPKKRKNVSDIFHSQLDIKMPVNGKIMSKRELLITATINDAIKGSPSARKMVFSMLGDDDVLEDFTPEMDDKIAMMQLSHKLERQRQIEEGES